MLLKCLSRKQLPSSSLAEVTLCTNRKPQVNQSEPHIQYDWSVGMCYTEFCFSVKLGTTVFFFLNTCLRCFFSFWIRAKTFMETGLLNQPRIQFMWPASSLTVHQIFIIQNSGSHWQYSLANSQKFARKSARYFVIFLQLTIREVQITRSSS